MNVLIVEGKEGATGKGAGRQEADNNKEKKLEALSVRATDKSARDSLAGDAAKAAIPSPPGAAPPLAGAGVGPPAEEKFAKAKPGGNF